MTHYKNRYLSLILLVTLLASACTKPWSQRDQVTDQNLNVNLFQQIQANANLSTFAGYLTKIGYDKLLASSKTYTVWAPVNSALASIDPAIVADTAQLHKFLNNHIANQTYLTTQIQGGSVRVHTLTGKNVTFTATTVEDANITSANNYVSNGVLHVIDKAIPPKQNISEYIRGLANIGLLQKAYVLRNDSTYTDTTKATVASIDPKTGKPILVAGTGQVTINKYFNKIAALANEDSTYTYIVLTDAAYNNERNKVSKYFTTATNNTDTTMNILAGYNVLKDMAIRGAIQPANLAAVLTSTLGVNVPMDKTQIVSTYNASNGIVYVMNAVNFAVADKITPITIEGERPSFYARTDQNAKVAFRAHVDPTGVKYNDIFISGSGLPAAFFSAYKISNLYTCQYRVVIRATNDTLITKAGAALPIKETVTFGQITGISLNSGGTLVPVNVVSYPPLTLVPYVYAETALGTATGTTTTTTTTFNVTAGNLNVFKYSSINMYVSGANVTTTNGNNVLFDYVKLYPILQ